MYQAYGIVGVLASLVAVAYAITVHEFAHARRALAAGDRTAEYQKRVSLNPIHHYDPIGTTALLLFGFGWAKPVPVNPMNFRHPRMDSVMVSLWGPLSNFLSAIGFAGIASLLFRVVHVSAGLEILFLELVTFNVLLGLFNLIPLPPLDGSHIVEGLLPYESARRYVMWTRQWGMILLIVLLFTGAYRWFIDPLFNLISGVLLRGF